MCKQPARRLGRKLQINSPWLLNTGGTWERTQYILCSWTYEACIPAGANVLLMTICFTPNFLLDDSQKGPKSHLEILAEMRDYKRRRQSYRAKNVHITKKSYTEVRLEKEGFFVQKCLLYISINNYILFQRQRICVFHFSKYCIRYS